MRVACVRDREAEENHRWDSDQTEQVVRPAMESCVPHPESLKYIPSAQAQVWPTCVSGAGGSCGLRGTRALWEATLDPILSSTEDQQVPLPRSLKEGLVKEEITSSLIRACQFCSSGSDF